MTDETKQLFDAPWTEGYDSDTGETWVTDKNGRRVADTSKHGMRIVRMPELYDALKQVTEGICRECSNVENIFELPCRDPQANECHVAQWRELLRKVRDGQ